IPAERTRQAARFHDAADGEPPLPVDRAERELSADAEMVVLRERSRQDDRIRPRQENERIVDDGFVAALEIIVAQAAIASEIDAEDEQAAFTAEIGTHNGLDHRHR